MKTIARCVSALARAWKWCMAEPEWAPGHGGGCRCEDCDDARLNDKAAP